MTDIHLALVSHTNVGKTTLARTLLARDVGEVRDAPHVTEFAEGHELIACHEPAPGDRLVLWDTPGFGDSARLVRRMRQSASPLGWLLSEVWDRWRDRAFWASQQALRQVRERCDVVLYLVNASEPAAGYLAPEMELLGWVDRPVVVLLNQMGPPREAADEAQELQQWRERLARWPVVREVLPLDAFARCWVQERRLLQVLQVVLAGEPAAALGRLAAAWQAGRERQFEAAMARLAQGLAQMAASRVEADGGGGLGTCLRELGGRLLGAAPTAPAAPEDAAQSRLAALLEAETRAATAALLDLHGLRGAAASTALEQVLARVAELAERHARVPEGRAALLGGALTGALTGLKADVATGGLSLGGGLIAGGLLGALGAAGLARGINVVRGTGRSWATFSIEALEALAEQALLRYLAVAHFGRGRGDWVEGEAPAHWVLVVREALAASASGRAALWQRRGSSGEADVAALTAALAPLLAEAARRALVSLYPESGLDNRRP